MAIDLRICLPKVTNYLPPPQEIEVYEKVFKHRRYLKMKHSILLDRISSENVFLSFFFFFFFFHFFFSFSESLESVSSSARV